MKAHIHVALFHPTQLFKSFEFGNGSRRVTEHTDCFHFTQITDKNLLFPFKNW